MDVIIETTDGQRFKQEIWFFSSVLEIKETLHKYHGFPVSRQTLILNGKIMEDDGNTENYEIVQGSRIFLRVEPEPGAVPAARTQTQITVKIPHCKIQFTLDANADDSVFRLKEKIQEKFHQIKGERLPAGRMALLHVGGELQDHQKIEECGICNGYVVEAVVRPISTAAEGMGNVGKRAKVAVVLPPPGLKRVKVEVNLADNVSELRKEMHKLTEVNRVRLATDGFFFIFKQRVMDEDRTFRWHDVKPGDVLEMFYGSVTAGA